MAFVKDSISSTHWEDLENTSELTRLKISHFIGTALLDIFYQPLNSDLAYSPASKTLFLSFLIPKTSYYVGILIYPTSTGTSIPPLHISSSPASLLCDMTATLSLQQLVNDTTRGNNTLDLVFTNTQDKVTNLQAIDAWTNFKDLLMAAADQCIPMFTLSTKDQRVGSPIKHSA